MSKAKNIIDNIKNLGLSEDFSVTSQDSANSVAEKIKQFSFNDQEHYQSFLNLVEQRYGPAAMKAVDSIIHGGSVPDYDDPGMQAIITNYLDILNFYGNYGLDN